MRSEQLLLTINRRLQTATNTMLGFLAYISNKCFTRLSTRTYMLSSIAHGYQTKSLATETRVCKNVQEMPIINKLQASNPRPGQRACIFHLCSRCLPCPS